MRKILALILALTMILSLTAIFSACDAQSLQDLQGIQGEKGEKGDKGDKGDSGNSIAKIERTATDGLIDTYTITFTDGTTTTFTVENGEKGEPGEKGETGNGVAKVEKTATDGLIDTYTVTFTDGSTASFTITNGEKGDKGDKGEPGDASAEESHTHTKGEVWSICNDATQLCDQRAYVSICTECGEAFLFAGSYESHKFLGIYAEADQHWTYCTECWVLGEAEDHDFSTAYSYDYQYHWNVCNVCETAGNIGGHQLDEDSICTVCALEVKAEYKQAEYNTTTTVMPSNWNEFTYADNNNTQIIDYIHSPFFEYDYKFADDKKYNADGSINKDGIVDGAYTVNYSAATKLEDVTALVASKWGYTAEQKAEGGYAWKITLRDDLKWDDGTPITAADFVYSMKQLLDPAFMNFRASTYYDSLMIKNSKAYFRQNQGGSYETIGSQGFASLQDAIDSGETIYANIWYMWGAEGYVDAYGNECPEYVSITDETVYDTAGAWASGTPWDAISGLDLYTYYGNYLEPGTGYDACVYVENTVRDVKWEDVGIYAVEGENAIVLCLDKSYSFLKEDGSLSVWAPNYFSSLPLVKRDLYESCKIQPAYGATLWTSNYNSSLATSASWGPYKLVEYAFGSHYRLEKNENWYGWNMELYRNQYNVTAINCRAVEEFSPKWLGFLRGDYDDASLQTENVGEYLNSKYVYFTSTSTGTFGMQLYSNLDVLKDSGNNNGILAIQEFRQAFNLALNRSDVVETIWPGSAIPCFGLLNGAYYYDIENSPDLADGGRYRNTTIAKEGILRAYGFEQGADGKWSSGALTGLSTEDAYDALTGYNPELARQKMQEAIDILLANPKIYGYDHSRYITIVYGASTDTSKQRSRATYLQEILDDLTRGTALENRINIVFDASAGSAWADAFRIGQTQIGFGYGFSGNKFNPFDIIGAFVNPDDSLNYHMYWDTSSIDLTLTMPAGEYAGAGETITMSIQNWYFCLNGLAETENQPKTYNWGQGYAPTEARLVILSALEEVTIKESRSIMLIADGGGSFLGAKFSYFTEEEHTFMGFGGIRYMEVNYTDAEWEAFLAENYYDLSSEYRKPY